MRSKTSLNERNLDALWYAQEKSIESNNIICKKRFLFHKKVCIENADMLEQIVNSLEAQLTAARVAERANNIHLFLDAPAALAFVLGNCKVFSGRIILYEYDQDSDSYYKSLERND
ncbi:MAG: SAVED domain-containing protein [Mediterraneibacter sp.]